jgi:hypothetical protein
LVPTETVLGTATAGLTAGTGILLSIGVLNFSVSSSSLHTPGRAVEKISGTHKDGLGSSNGGTFGDLSKSDRFVFLPSGIFLESVYLPVLNGGDLSRSVSAEAFLGVTERSLFLRSF